jgi:hypothetical protein
MAIKVRTRIDTLIMKGFEALNEEIDLRVTRAFQMACKETVTWAKQNHEYSQQTGALNSSTGFQLYKDGSLVDSHFEQSQGGDDTNGAKGQGVAIGQKVAEQRASELGAHICGVIVAGMPYAIHVESKGYDVLTGAEKQFPSILEKWMQQAFNNTGMSFSISE